MSINLTCLVLRHRWRPAEAANEAGLKMACARCGKVRKHVRTGDSLTADPSRYGDGPNFSA